MSPILPRTSIYLEIGELLFQCNKRFKPRLFTLDFDVDEEGLNRLGSATLVVHECDRSGQLLETKYEKKEVELVKKDLMNILGDYYHGN